jgi:hypothetical protein
MINSHSLVALAAIAALLLFGDGSASAQTPEPKKAQGAARSDIPSNYRQVVARYLTKNASGSKVLKAEISRPGVWSQRWDGPHQIVCARWVTRGPFIDQTNTLGFIFRSGQIVEVFNPGYANPAMGGFLGAALLNAATCGKLAYSPLPEAVQSVR